MRRLCYAWEIQCGGVSTQSPVVAKMYIQISGRYSTVEAAWFSWETLANIGIIGLKTRRLIEYYTTC